MDNVNIRSATASGARFAILAAGLFLLAATLHGQDGAGTARRETRSDYDRRMAWWNEARFGLFIHWGLYAVPAGEWDGKTTYGEWIRTSAQIPLETYDAFRPQFNPVRFNALEWVRLAKDAGMRYIVITTKHHDGFCLFDSKHTDFDVMATPFKRDIMKELADACRAEQMTLCFYHSIMDWHHPDYLPRRNWETTRTTEGASYDRYVSYMKNQLHELLTRYGRIGVLWFDGEWEGTWTRDRGLDLYQYVRGLQPDIIVNNRVGAGRSGMEGFSTDTESAGDFGTPEQQIPRTGVPDVYWETCMTMNDHWGYNKHDDAWKSTGDILRMMADIASKGGNYLLNVGPTAEGVFPDESIARLKEIGIWMRKYGESIYGTEAGPFSSLTFGRCTRKETPEGTRLYLHVFDWPSDGRLVVHGLYNDARAAFVLSDAARTPLATTREEDALVISVPSTPEDTMNTVIALDIDGVLDVSVPPTIATDQRIFIDALHVPVTTSRPNVDVHYTTDGTMPTAASPRADGGIRIEQTTTISVRCFRDGKPVSDTATATFTRVLPLVSPALLEAASGIAYRYYEGEWDSIPDFPSMTPVKEGTVPTFTFEPRREKERFGFRYSGYFQIQKEGVYTFFLRSDDGSRLRIGGQLVVDHDGAHGSTERSGEIALAPGLHPFVVDFFEQTGSEELTVSISGPGMQKQALPEGMLFH